MTRERLTKPIAALQRTPDTPAKTRVPAQQGRFPGTLEAKPVNPEQLELRRQQSLEIQRQANLELQHAAMQRAHDVRLSTARAAQTTWHTSSLKSVALQRAISEHAQTARAAIHTRAAFIAQRSTQTLEALRDERFEAAVRPTLPVAQRQADLTLSHVADHLGDKAAVQLARDPQRLSSFAGFKNTGASLVKTFRTPGSSHTMPQLASAIQRFRDPMQRAAVESAAFAAFGSHPTYPQQLQRALEERDSQLELQRENWKSELEPVAQRKALEEASGEGAAGMIEAARGGGSPLPAGVRNLLETKWNTDLAKVTVHTDVNAQLICKKFNAKALTSANNMFFAAGMWNPTSLEGLQLIAHEAWHTVQQAGGLVEKGVDKNRNLELEAQAKGAELSSEDVQIALSNETQATKNPANTSSKTASASATVTRALQRKPNSSPAKQQSPKGEGLWVPVGSGGYTRQTLMVELLVKYGFDRELAQTLTNEQGNFRYGGDNWGWVNYPEPTAQEIKERRIWIHSNFKKQKERKQTAIRLNKQFRAENANKAKPNTNTTKQTVQGTPLFLRGAAFSEEFPVKLRSSMDSSKEANNIIEKLPFGTTFLIFESISRWYKIKLDSGQTGFVAADNISIAPDAGAIFYKIDRSKEDTAITIATRSYEAKPGLDLRFYVLVLEKINPNSIRMPEGIDWNDKSSWTKANALDGNYIWIPSKTYAKSLKGTLSNGSLRDDPLEAAAQVGKGIVKKTIADLGGGKVIETLETIGKDVNLVWDNPGAFMTNLHTSFTQGFGNFQAKFGDHLQAGVMDWLQSALGAEFSIPKKPDAAGLMSVGLQVAGLDYTNNLRPMLASSLPSGGLAQLEASGGVLQEVAKTNSLTPVMQMVQSREKAFKGMLDGLPEMILGSLKDFAVNAIVTAGIKKMMTMLIPGGGLVQAAISIYNAITFFMDRAKQIGKFLKNLTSSFASVAKGDIAGAVIKIEDVLKTGLSLSLGFLASAAGLTKIASSIKATLNKIQKPAQKVLTKISDWIVKMFKSLLKGKGAKPITSSNAKPRDGRTTAEKGKAVKEAVAEATKLMGTTEVSKESAQQKLEGIKAKYKVTKLEFIQDSKKPYRFRAFAQINPEFTGPPGVLLTYSELKGLSKVAAGFAKDIREKPGFRARYLADKYEFIRTGGNVKIGDSVEAAALPAIREMARKEGLTLVVSPELFLVDSQGNKIGGSRLELDFLMVRDKAVVKVLSAKISINSFRGSQDRKLLKHFLEIPSSKPDIVTYANDNFGRNRAYANIDHAIVESSMGRETLSSFREKYLSETKMENVTVEPIVPKPGDGRGYQLRVDDKELIDVVIRFIDKKI